MRNANGQRIKLFTDFGSFDSVADAERAEWRSRILSERKRQVEKGYDAEHDSEHGVDHLLVWAQEYARLGESLESAALIEAARELLAPVHNHGPHEGKGLACHESRVNGLLRGECSVPSVSKEKK